LSGAAALSSPDVFASCGLENIVGYVTIILPHPFRSRFRVDTYPIEYVGFSYISRNAVYTES
jgi:hypothetical protein